MTDEISQTEIDKLYERLNKEAEAGGYHLNHDVEFAKDLVRGLLVNEKRYGYWSCPCRLTEGSKQADLDIICPCDYRDADVVEFGNCYCALYVSTPVLKGEKKSRSIAERRPERKERAQYKTQPVPGTTTALGTVTAPSSVTVLSKPVWRCRVCGYLCARDEPPELCPVCKAKKDRFERFM